MIFCRPWCRKHWDRGLFPFDPQGRYLDHGCSSECYCNHSFLELETLAPLARIEPYASGTLTETWELHQDFSDESAIQAILRKIGME